MERQYPLRVRPELHFPRLRYRSAGGVRRAADDPHQVFRQALQVRLGAAMRFPTAKNTV